MKTHKQFLIVAFIALSALLSLKVIYAKYKTVRCNYLIESRGKAQHFINSYID